VKRERKLIAEKVHSFSGYAGTVTRAVKQKDRLAAVSPKTNQVL
jgi:hypothetical protein